jgi:molecular chaperone GrpE
MLRLQADFDNFRKRTARERGELGARAIEDLVKALLPVLDHFELGLKSAAEHKVDAAVHDGFQMVYNDLLAALKSFGLAPIDAHSAGFDPHQHEAVAHVPSNEYVADQIVAQTRRGYRLGERLLRPVQVVVSSGPGAPRGDGMEQGEEQPEVKA